MRPGVQYPVTGSIISISSLPDAVNRCFSDGLPPEDVLRHNDRAERSDRKLQRDTENRPSYPHDAVTEKGFATGANGHLITTEPNASDDELYTTDILRNALNVKKFS